MTNPRPPKGLSDQAKAWWRSVVDHYELEAHQFNLLRAAAEDWDDYTKARTQIEAEGRTVPGREGIDRPHPLTNVARDSRAAFARIVDQLKLETGEPARGVGRPPQNMHWNG